MPKRHFNISPTVAQYLKSITPIVVNGVETGNATVVFLWKGVERSVVVPLDWNDNAGFITKVVARLATVKAQNP